jgi:hypothetical protein
MAFWQLSDEINKIFSPLLGREGDRTAPGRSDGESLSSALQLHGPLVIRSHKSSRQAVPGDAGLDGHNTSSQGELQA